MCERSIIQGVVRAVQVCVRSRDDRAGAHLRPEPARSSFRRATAAAHAALVGARAAAVARARGHRARIFGGAAVTHDHHPGLNIRPRLIGAVAVGDPDRQAAGMAVLLVVQPHILKAHAAEWVSGIRLREHHFQRAACRGRQAHLEVGRRVPNMSIGAVVCNTAPSV